MAVEISSTIKFHLTGGIAGSINTNPFLSLGGQMAVEILSDKLENLFDPVSSSEQNNGRTEYRWIVMNNLGQDSIVSPHFYFLPKDPYIDIEFSRLAVSAPVTILPTEEDRPIEAEIGPELDVPMPFTRTTEDYETTLSIGPDIPPGGKLYICVRRVIPEDAVSENRAAVLVCESRISVLPSTSDTGKVTSLEVEP